MLSTRFGNMLSDLESVRREFDRFFGSDDGFVAATPAVPVSLWEDEEHVYLEVDVPGLQKDDLDLSIENGRLWIRGQRKQPQTGARQWYDERRYGRFERVIALSEMVEPGSIDAQLEGGVLSVTLTKRPGARTHRISIRAGNDEPKRLETQTGEAESART